MYPASLVFALVPLFQVSAFVVRPHLSVRTVSPSGRLPLNFAESKGFGKQASEKTQAKQKRELSSENSDTTFLASSLSPASQITDSDDAATNGKLTKEERQEAILRSFGLDKMEDRKDDSKGGVKLPDNAFDADGDLNLLAFIPMEVQGGIESLLYFTTGALLFVFIVAGIGITWDAYAISTKGSLPGAVAGLITEILEPNFTNIGLAFLASSSSLGFFKVAQFSNPDVQYSETYFEDPK